MNQINPMFPVLFALWALPMGPLSGCEGTGPPDDEGAMDEPIALVHNEAWVAVEPSADHFVVPTPISDECVQGDGFLSELFGEDLVLSVDTAKCTSLTVEQDLLHDLPPHGFVTGRVWHFALAAENPAMAWVAITIGDTLVWSEQVAIPSESGLILIKWRAALGYAAGEPIRFHVQNHGSNSWHLIDLSYSI